MCFGQRFFVRSCIEQERFTTDTVFHMMWGSHCFEATSNCLSFLTGVRIGMWPWQQTVALLDWTKEELQNLQSGLCRVEERLQKQQALEVKSSQYCMYNLLDYYAGIPTSFFDEQIPYLSLLGVRNSAYLQTGISREVHSSSST